ncbi:uncharacterized protein LOC120721921 [Simochromis diagramma]|uniref:uncharacterized protein LOC120721921 n=1 Tax=Simochromis diagramma TaxID=43689 RepID=UPI001A7EF907|nr:uncharacterized protein LOC120721921 [Simochromis diagramma]
MLDEMALGENPQEKIGKDRYGRDMGGDVDPPGPPGIFPMIAVPNPRYGQLTGKGEAGGEAQRDNNPTTFVFRPWSQKDRQNVLKDVPPLNEGFIPWRDAVEMIRRQWYLNGHEMLQVIQDILGLKMGTVRGDFTGSAADGTPLTPVSQDLETAVANLYDRIRVRLAPRADYGKIGEVKQKENETASDFLDRLRPVFRQHSGMDYNEGPDGPYQQQLKNAFLNGLLPSVKFHVEKHWVTMNTGPLADALQHAEHALRVIKKKTARTGIFTLDPETGFIAFSGGFRGNRQGQRRGNRGRGRGGFRGKGQRYVGQTDLRERSEERDNTCWNCGKEGHFARDCRHKNRQTAIFK